MGNNFKEIVDSLGFRFPVATLVKELKHSKGSVSQYYNGKLEPSENFKEKFLKAYNIDIDKPISSQEEKSIVNLKATNMTQVAIFVSENEDLLMKERIFSNIIELRVAKRIAQISSSPEKLKEWLK